MNGNLRCQEAFHLLNIFHLFTNKSYRLFANKFGIVQQVYPTGQRVIGLNSTHTLKYCSSAYHDTASHSLQFTLLTGVGRVKLRFDDTFLDSRPMRGIQPRTTLTFISHSVSLCISYCVPAICILYVSNSDCLHTISWNGMILSFVVVVYGTAQFIIMKSLLQQPDVLHKLYNTRNVVGTQWLTDESRATSSSATSCARLFIAASGYIYDHRRAAFWDRSVILINSRIPGATTHKSPAASTG